MNYSIVVIGAGAGGLVVAIGAAKAGKKVLLIEKGHWGGDCTNFGCIPSKSLIAYGNVHHPENPLEGVRKIVASIRAHEEPEALNKLGVDTIQGTASFIDSHTLTVNDQTIKTKKIVLACGSHPFVPPIEGLQNAPYLTNETIFSLEKIPDHLAILGAGPIGCELAQAFNKLGSKVTIIESTRGVLPNEDPAVAEVMAKRFADDGIELHIKCDTSQITYENNQFSICTTDGDITCDKLLISTGRRPNIDELNLAAAGINHSDTGLPVDAYGRTNQKHIYAIGDFIGGPQFTHVAENHGRAVLTSLLVPLLNKKFSTQAIPHCTFTDPEVASIGLTESEAVEQFGKKKIATYTVPFEEIDRAITARRTEGFVKVVTRKWSSKILGATIVAPRAGEMLPEISLSMLHNIPLRKLSNLIHPYPIYNAAFRKAADQWLTKTVLKK